MLGNVLKVLPIILRTDIGVFQDGCDVLKSFPRLSLAEKSDEQVMKL